MNKVYWNPLYRKQSGGLGAEFPAAWGRRCDDFTAFFKKIRIFRYSLVEVSRFKWLNKALMRPQGLRLGAHVPHLPRSCYVTGRKSKDITFAIVTVGVGIGG